MDETLTQRQKLMKKLYPAIMFVTKLFGKKNQVLSNREDTKPAAPVYQLGVELNNGTTLPLSQLQGKKILFVNTASNCGYTGQYAELQQLQEQFGDRLQVIGFPANDFKEQEKGSDEEIARFCQVNYGVRFPLAKKSVVIKAPQQHPVFKWLTDKDQNGWNAQPPSWNFSKYLLDESGRLTHYFDPSVSPLSAEVKKAIENKLTH